MQKYEMSVEELKRKRSGRLSYWNTAKVLFVLTLSIVLLASAYAERIGDSKVFVHNGICDASGVVELGNSEFAVADDELNLLLVYQTGASGAARASFELSEFLGVVKEPKTKKKSRKGGKKKNRKKNKKEAKQKGPKKPKVKEVDIEGAARVGDSIYWITSHGRKSSGKGAEERMRLFATSINYTEGVVQITPKGQPYEELLDSLLADERYAPFGLKKASEKAPKETGGLNIEGLTDRPDGSLLIGFRSPLIAGKALVAPLLNPDTLIAGGQPKFGAPLLLNLEGHGIRGMSSHNGEYLLVANDPEGDGHSPALYRWDGKSETPAIISSIEFGDFNPEAVAFLPGEQKGKVLLLSDDGTRIVGQEKCKDLKDLSLRQFRSTLLTISGS